MEEYEFVKWIQAVTKSLCHPLLGYVRSVKITSAELTERNEQCSQVARTPSSDCKS